MPPSRMRRPGARRRSGPPSLQAVGAFFLLGAILTSAPPAGAGPPASAPDFARDIRPIFEKRCYECHGPEKREGGLRLTNRRDAFTPGDFGIPVIEPNAAEHSYLFEVITSSDEEERMPKEGPALSADEIESIRRWIDGGAIWLDQDSPKHWAYVAPERPALPAVRRDAWPRNEIDTFILARQEAAGFEPNPQAEPARLLRRLHLDLIGIPPTPEQVEAFEKNPSEEAYRRIVDELLDSPQYGERWAVHWLDLARYADSNGFQTDQIYTAWPYRDWVIDAFNEDMPFNQFTVEQLAGDLLPRAALSQRIATGFHRSATTSIEAGVYPEEDRVRQIVDRVNVTATIWLGSTLECAQCHNHKYDPFSQQEYYELFAFFNNTPIEVAALGSADPAVAWKLRGPTIPVPLTDAEQARRQSLITRIRSENQRLLARDTDEDFERWKRETRKALGVPVEWNPTGTVDVQSSGDETHRLLDDDSIAIDGPVPDAVVHAIEVAPRERPVTALRIEILPRPATDPPRSGGERLPPRISGISVTPSAQGQDPLAPLDLWVARHDSRAHGAIVRESAQIWKTRDRSVPDAAVFLFDGPPTDADTLLVVLEQQHGQGASIDRIRISTTTASRTLAALPEDVARLPVQDGRTAEEEARLRAYFDAEGRLVGTDLPSLRRARNRLRPAHTRVLEELPMPRKTHVLKRGSFRDPGSAVSPETPGALHPYSDGLPRNRLGLALWLVDPANPLVARVTVNRWWAEFFGQGLVRTPEDFGTRGDSPTHPDLLDWLALDFIENGWSMKKLHRKIVLSATYKQSSRRYEQHEEDPANTLYARSQRRRLPAELLRDNALAISGLLSPRMAGPPAYPPQPSGLWNHEGDILQARYRPHYGDDRFRRGVYVVWRRSSPYPSFVAFDAPDRTTCATRRSTTNTPLQALVLLNDQAYVEMAAGLAERILQKEDLDGDRERAAFALRLAVARPPRPGDVEDLVALLDRERLRFGRTPEAALALVETTRWATPDTGLDPVEFAAWFSVANVILNLDETITRS